MVEVGVNFTVWVNGLLTGVKVFNVCVGTREGCGFLVVEKLGGIYGDFVDNWGFKVDSGKLGK